MSAADWSTAAMRGGPASCRGLTLVELLVTLAIIGILASAAIPMTELAVQRTREQELRSALRDIRNAIDAYRQAVREGRIATQAGESGYPRSLDELVSGVADQRSPTRARIYFLRRLPRDPLAEAGDAGRWGLRSYASAPDDPKEGKDVFDVFSRSPGVGLNGVPYREW